MDNFIVFILGVLFFIIGIKIYTDYQIIKLRKKATQQLERHLEILHSVTHLKALMFDGLMLLGVENWENYAKAKELVENSEDYHKATVSKLQSLLKEI